MTEKGKHGRLIKKWYSKYQKQFKEECIYYLYKCGFRSNTLIDYIRSSKSTKGIKRAISKEIINTLCNEDLDLCKYELSLAKDYGLHEVKRFYYSEQKRENESFYKEHPELKREVQ